MITTNSGLQYEDIRTGSESDDVAKVGDQLVVHYTGCLINGTEFDSSRARNQPFIFSLGKGQVIKGRDEGLIGLRVGGLRKLIIPPALGYGPRGAGDKIPPNATLIFEVELVGVNGSGR